MVNIFLHKLTDVNVLAQALPDEKGALVSL
jgi:hypothetical protein